MPGSLRASRGRLPPRGRRRDDARRRLSAASRSRVPVKVAQAAVQPPLSFRLDVMPVFMRAGCNTGSCHGAARGKDGFRISLFGFDPEGDHFRLTREMVGRRINLAVPSDSTLLEKSIGAVPAHRRQAVRADSELYQTLHGWIEAGAPNDDAAKLPKVVGVDLYPKQAVLDGKGSTQQLTVRARYSDGTDRDVTSLAVFLTNNDVSAAGQPRRPGHRRRARRGVRDGPVRDHTVGSQFIVLPKGLKFTFPDEPEANYIDKLVNAKLKKLRIAPSGICDDETFLRRADDRHRRPAADASRNTTGSWPRPTPHKRSKWIDELLERKEFSEIWVIQVGRAAPGPDRSRTQRQPEGDVPLLQLAGRQALEEHADGPDGPGAAWAPAAARSRTPATNFYQIDQRDAAADRERGPGLHGHPRSSAPSATTIRSIAGPRTTTTASPRSSPRSAASRARTIARRSSSTRAAAR